LPTLPATLTTVDCEGNLLRSLPPVPPGIRFLLFLKNPLNVYFQTMAADVQEANSMSLCVKKIAEYNQTVSELRNMWKNTHVIPFVLPLHDDLRFLVGSYLSGENGTLLSQKRSVRLRLEEYMS
jgi:hypothetical protein